MQQKVLLIGSGFMGLEYAKVLSAQHIDFEMAGRSEQRVAQFHEKFPHVITHSGGLEKYLSANQTPDFAIVAVSLSDLFTSTASLIKKGVKNILVEKPAALSLGQIRELLQLSVHHRAKVLIAYNRRFYQSVKMAKEMIEEDGGILSSHFEFTEWIHTLDTGKYGEEAMSRWILGNSSHVIDLVFHLIGRPEKLNVFAGGKEIPWHPSGSIFLGQGVSVKSIPFTYHSNWLSPGRWSIEILTRKHRLYFRPMEKLAVQNIGSVAVNEAAGDYSIDLNFKPGLFNQVTTFMSGMEQQETCTLEEHCLNFPFFEKIGGY